jgi:DNA-binding GntR family transcriptional regulator
MPISIADLFHGERWTLSHSNGWPTLSTLDSASRPDRIAELLREAIRTGRFPRGSQVVESRFAKQLGVGQNAVREALHRLEFEGFVSKIPSVGTFVTTLSRHDVDEIYRMRIELEALAVYWAREKNRPSGDDLRQINEYLDDAARAARTGDLIAYARADTQLHRYLWKMAGNHYLEKCLELVAVPQLSCALLESEGPLKLDLESLAARHREWVEAIRTQPPRVAYIHTRKRLSDFWGDVEVAMNAGSPSANAESEPDKAVGVSPG